MIHFDCLVYLKYLYPALKTVLSAAYITKANSNTQRLVIGKTILKLGVVSLKLISLTLMFSIRGRILGEGGGGMMDIP